MKLLKHYKCNFPEWNITYKSRLIKLKLYYLNSLKGKIKNRQNTYGFLSFFLYLSGEDNGFREIFELLDVASRFCNEFGFKGLAAGKEQRLALILAVLTLEGDIKFTWEVGRLLLLRPTLLAVGNGHRVRCRASCR